MSVRRLKGVPLAVLQVVVGGENRWKYDTFVNWDFLPSENFPILVYFRETQTPAANREDVPLVVDELDGQVHFFPAISDAQQVRLEGLHGLLLSSCIHRPHANPEPTTLDHHPSPPHLHHPS